MPSLISGLSKPEQEKLFADLYYLNMGEIRSFCAKHSIPFKIFIETPSGKLKSTRDADRKKIVLERVRIFLETGDVKPATVFRQEVVDLDGLPEKIDENTRLFYGCYEKKNPEMIGLLKELTDGKFKNGAIARILCREFWSRGEAPTMKEYAIAWVKANEEYSLKQHPEAAFLTDRSRGAAGKNWKKVRKEKARRVIEVLSKIDT